MQNILQALLAKLTKKNSKPETLAPIPAFTPNRLVFSHSIVGEIGEDGATIKARRNSIKSFDPAIAPVSLPTVIDIETSIVGHLTDISSTWGALIIDAEDKDGNQQRIMATNVGLMGIELDGIPGSGKELTKLFFALQDGMTIMHGKAAK